MSKYVLLFSSGRSGSLWLLRLFDLSPFTFCRYDWRLGGVKETDPPYPILGDYSTFDIAGDVDISKSFDESLQWLAGTHSRFDEPGSTSKYYLTPMARAIGLPFPTNRKTINFAIRLLVSPFSSPNAIDRWSTRAWYYRQDMIQEAVKIFKWTPSLGCLSYLAQADLDVSFVHLVRHPGGRLASWNNRWASRFDEEEIISTIIPRLTRIADFHPDWPRLTESIRNRNLWECQLWEGRHLHETIANLFEGNPRYIRVTYEQLCEAPVAEVKRLYAHCDVPWSSDIENQVSNLAEGSQNIANKWKNQLSDEQRSALRVVFENSAMRDWFSNGSMIE